MDMRELGSIPSGLSLMNLLCILLLAIMRLAPIVQFAPFLGAKLIPRPARVGLALGLTFLFLPPLLQMTPSLLVFNIPFIGYCIKELVIGFFLAMLVSAPFFIAESSGTIVDFMRGSSKLMAQDPTTQIQASSLGILYNYLLIALFFQFGGFEIFFDTFLKSYQLIPIDQLLSPSFFQSGTPMWIALTGFLGKIFALAIQASAPAILGILMAETFLGIANRLAPQVQIVFLGMPLKSLLGLLLLALGWIFILKQILLNTTNWLHDIDHLLLSFQR